MEDHSISIYAGRKRQRLDVQGLEVKLLPVLPALHQKNAKDLKCHKNKLAIRRPPYTSCKTPQMKAEIAGSRYAIVGDEKEGESTGLQEELCFFESVINTRSGNKDNNNTKDPRTPPKGSRKKATVNSGAQERHHCTTSTQGSKGQHKPQWVCPLDLAQMKT